MSDIGEAVEWIWAKSGVDDRQALVDWLPLWTHLTDSATIAGLLWEEWLSPQARHVVVDAAGNEESAVALVRFLAGVHDIGKATPVFQAKVPVLAQQLRDHGLPIGFDVTSEDKRRLPHGLAGQVILETFLVRRGWRQQNARQLGAIVGGHHGIPPELGEVDVAYLRPILLGDPSWEAVQAALLAGMERRAGVDLDHLRGREIGQPAAVLLTGLVIVADWIASNASLCHLTPIGRQPAFHPERARQAWGRLGLPRPWCAIDSGLDADRLLAERFGLGSPGAAAARPVQEAALREARTCDVPGVLVIEAPMGEGKTEAAFLAAEVIAARTGASGCFVALPTQATTNAMFDRVLDWLPRLPDDTSEGSRHSVELAHGRALLDPRFRGLREHRSSGIHLDDGALNRTGQASEQKTVDAYVHWWMTNRKKSPLADFAVGTIDQLLFAALQARHVALRHLGLAGKVVVVDEVHAYDAYMSVYLDRVLEWLGAYGVSVILLSATLPGATRDRLVEAYRKGRSAMSTPVADWVVPTWDSPDSGLVPTSSVTQPPPDVRPAYPALTAFIGGEAVTRDVPASTRSTTVDIELLGDGVEALMTLLNDALEAGGCALVVRNTVKRAQETYHHLASRFAQHEVSLHHSRFLASDRALNDGWLRSTFGPSEASGSRPHRHVVVATQVAEQSLDIDFDLLVTDCAPIDLVLQRVGRLHRHQRSRPSRLERARCVVVADDWSSVPPSFTSGSESVYDRWTLVQSARLLTEKVAAGIPLTLPDDIAGLVHEAYDDAPLRTGPWAAPIAEARAAWEKARIRQETRARTFRLPAPRAGVVGLNGWLGRSVGEADDSVEGLAQVRDSEDSIEVLVLVRTADGVIQVPDWLHDERAGEIVPVNDEPDGDLARLIAGCTLRLPAWLCRGAAGEALIKALDAAYFPMWQRVPELRGQLILVMDEDAGGGAIATVAGTRFRYHPTTGLATESETHEPKEAP